jgi:hypothetical protein
MRKIVLCITILCILASCSTQKIFLNQLPENETASVSFSEATTSVCFFGEKNDSNEYLKHHTAEQEVSNYFGPVTVDFPVFNIGTENYVSYKNERGDFVFYRQNLKGKYGIVISNGIDMPIIESNPKKYLSKIKSYLKKNNEDIINEEKQDSIKESNFQVVVKELTQKNVLLGKDYADALIKNANNIRSGYPFLSKFKKEKRCIFKKQTTSIYEDLKMTKKSPSSYIYFYDENGQPTKINYYLDKKITNTTTYSRNGYDLIEKITHDNQGQILTLRYHYYPDKFYVITYEGDRAISYDIYYLNEKKQCNHHLTYENDQSISLDETFRFDEFGRIIEETKKDSQITYAYKDSKSYLFSEFKMYNLNPKKLLVQNAIVNEKNTETYIGKNAEGKQTYKSITITSPDCSIIKSTNYDDKNKFTSSSIINNEK